MAGNTMEKSPEKVTTVETISLDFPVWKEYLERLAGNAWVRYQKLKAILNQVSIHPGIHTIERNSDGSWVLTRPGADGKMYKFTLPKEVLYQDIEEWPKEFPYIKFRRNAKTNTYTIEWTEVEIPTVNLDRFKEELAKVSGPFITECGARKSQYDLACTVEKNTWIRWELSLEQKGIWWWITPSTSVNLNKLVALTGTQLKTASTDWADHIKLGNILAKSLPLK
jgi:hypothetical protein